MSRLAAEVEEWKARAVESENALREIREKHRTLLKNIPQRIFYKDPNSTYVLCSESFAANLRIGLEEIRGKTDYDFFPKELADKYLADDRRIILSGQAENIEERYLKGEEIRIANTYKAPVRDAKGEIVGILGVFSDISVQKKAEEVLQKSEERLKTVFESVPDGIYICDARGTFVDGNTAAEKLIGYSRDELIGKSFLKLSVLPKSQIPRAAVLLARNAVG